MSLVFDLAEAVNLLVGAALGENAASIRERLADLRLRRQLKKAFVKTIELEVRLSADQRAALTDVVRTDGLISILCGLDSPDTARAASQFESAVEQVDETLRPLLLAHLRDSAVRTIDASLPTPLRLVYQSVRPQQHPFTGPRTYDTMMGYGLGSPGIEKKLTLPETRGIAEDADGSSARYISPRWLLRFPTSLGSFQPSVLSMPD